MKLISALSVAALMVSPGMMSAEEYPWLTFRLTDSTELSVAAEGLVMNYADGRLTLSSDLVDQSMEVTSIRSMRFTTYATVGIEGVDEAAYSTAEYFTPAGVSVGSFASVNDARHALPSGIYVARGTSSTFKVIF